MGVGIQEPSQGVSVYASAAAAFQTYRRTNVFRSLDGVRALCCIWVIKAHSGWLSGIRILDTPGLGVEMFFTISGFLIVTLLIREREKNGTISLRNFYARRSLRIFPVYYASILLVLIGTLLLAAMGKVEPFRFYRLPFLILLTYTQDLIPVNLGSFHPCWSLAVEEQFYLAWPTIEKLTSARVRLLILGGVILLSELVNFGVFKGLIQRFYCDPQADLMPLFIVTFAPIALGVCLAHLLNHPPTYQLAFRVLGYRWSPIVWIAALALIFVFSPPEMAGLPRLSVHLTLVLLLASLVIREDHFAARVLRFPFVARVGAISYGLYLYHQWVIDYLTRPADRLIRWTGMPAMNSFPRFVILAAVSILLADLSFRFFEKPILRLRSRFQS
jgi:peptidoglycan/LPS O-acetylase OafA/YrhL